MPLWCFVKTKKVFFVFSKLVFFFWVSSSPSFFSLSFLVSGERERLRERERVLESLLEKYRESGVFIGFSLRGKKVWWASSTSASALTVKKKKKVVEAGS